jgi:hypothetical protein
MHNNQNNHVDGKYEVEERRRKVCSMLSQSMTEATITTIHLQNITQSQKKKMMMMISG